MRLALANAFDLRRMQAVDLLASLILPLFQHPARQMQGPPKDRVQLIVTGDPPGDVADGAAEIGLQPAQGFARPLELLGMGVSAA